jgi:hypothetical protein
MVARAGFESGMKMRNRMARSLAPSMRAASSRLSGA